MNWRRRRPLGCRTLKVVTSGSQVLPWWQNGLQQGPWGHRWVRRGQRVRVEDALPVAVEPLRLHDFHHDRDVRNENWFWPKSILQKSVFSFFELTIFCFSRVLHRDRSKRSLFCFYLYNFDSFLFNFDGLMFPPPPPSDLEAKGRSIFVGNFGRNALGTFVRNL